MRAWKGGLDKMREIQPAICGNRTFSENFYSSF